MHGFVHAAVHGDEHDEEHQEWKHDEAPNNVAPASDGLDRHVFVQVVRLQAALAPKLLALASSSALMTSNHVRRAVGLRIHSGPDELVPPALLRRPASVTDFPCAARASLNQDPPPPPRNGTCANDGIKGKRPRELVLANTAPGFDPYARQPPPRVLVTGMRAASRF